MRQLKYLAIRSALPFGIALAVTAAAGCTGEGVNQANVYSPQGGMIDLNIDNLADPMAYVSVDFEVDGKNIGRDEDGSDGWSFKLDSSELTNGIHNVRAIGNTALGTTEELLNSSLYIQNDGAAAPSTPANGEDDEPTNGSGNPAGIDESDLDNEDDPDLAAGDGSDLDGEEETDEPMALRTR